ncbi:MAG: acylphosphatase [Candidatus Eremiobacteraeota bacterium]|nr:acylphosphatase [Candidatus Eremiobacteraeota bacterium]
MSSNLTSSDFSSFRTPRFHLVVRGRVQGVCYRAAAADKAAALDITGWISNRTDGSVEIVAEGSADRLGEFYRWCRSGPPGAHVTEAHGSTTEGRGEFESFSIRAY